MVTYAETGGLWGCAAGLPKGLIEDIGEQGPHTSPEQKFRCACLVFAADQPLVQVMSQHPIRALKVSIINRCALPFLPSITVQILKSLVYPQDY